MNRYYIIMAGRIVGPMTLQQLSAYPLSRDTQVSTDGMNWDSLFTYPELMQLLQAQRHAANSSYGATDFDHRQVAAAVLAILLGTLGLQYFYLGKTTAGIISILLGLCTCGIWSVVTVVQGVLMLTMPAEEFRRKFVDSNATFPVF